MKTSSHIIRNIAAAAALLGLAACENLPGTRTQQATGAGAAAGAAVGAAVSDNDLIGALLGGAAGAAGGYLIGARTDWFDGDDEARSAAARRAMERAEEDPATAADVERSRTADLNDDGFVTMDELVAMEEAGLSDDEMIERLEATGQVFELDAEQRRSLMDAGLSRQLVAEIQEINRDERDRVLGRSDVISRSGS
jgi:hypothetical protein